MYRFVSCILLLGLLVACTPVQPTLAPTFYITSTAEPKPLVPDFEHIVLIVFENKGFDRVIGNPLMLTFNKLAQENTLLTEYFAIRHPSLPNYVALIGGDTFGIHNDCKRCFINAPSLPDLIEASGRTWKTYQEDMPWPCYLGDMDAYVQKHNPFVYFNPIRLNADRCQRSVVPLTELKTDIEADSLPNFIFIKPNICNDSHNARKCNLDVADKWLTNLLNVLIPALDAKNKLYLVVMLFEEGEGPQVCCGLPEPGGGRVPVVLYSPLVKKRFEDPTPYTHYSLLKTIAESWRLSYLGHAADDTSVLITAPWK